MRTALIDGDTVIFAAASSTEYEVEWEPWLWTLWGNLDEAKETLDRKIEQIQEATEADRVVIALSADPPRWRERLWPEQYKMNRAGSRKPVTYKPLRAYVHEKYETYERPGLEGDDVLGMIATNPRMYPGEKIVCAIDKDLKTVPCTLYNYDKQTFTEISQYEADYFWMTQTLTGDPTDGYPGCPGIGPKKAEKILNGLGTIEEMWEAVVETYEKAGLGEEMALMNARVARICRATDYDYERKEVILWSPK